jgi:hypothetical protein
LAKLEYHSIYVAGGMEMIMGLSAAAAGFFHSKISKVLTFKNRLFFAFVALIFFSLLIYIYSGLLSIVFIGTFFIGFNFGYLRVELRTFLSKHFHPDTAGEIVSAANSWSGPLVLLYCLIFYLNASSSGIEKGLNITFPISFIIVAFFFCALLLSDMKYIEKV